MPNDSQNDGNRPFDENHRGNNVPPANAGIPHVSRRNFMQSAIAAATVASMPLSNAQVQTPMKRAEPGQKPEPPFAPAQSMSLRINGRQYDLTLEPRVTLLDALREVIGLTGTKKGCDHGQCGACTVLVNGRRINSCLTLAIMNDGADITTIEGLAGPGDELHPLQAAFLDHDAFQCGYCTPGQICSAAAMLSEYRTGTASAVTPNVRDTAVKLSDAEIRERMSGNICRCGAYPNIVAAIRVVAGNKT
ncbi:MAG TPA: 2Fe-2S iron-sulfur cluster-binding protein [Burkholderiaceae bacterium]|nr:2Fe-2S iron-sulfur cluster-binding protein [Burkholderiaceae bacterium]